jgi:GcrA cell cycle regulator
MFDQSFNDVDNEGQNDCSARPEDEAGSDQAAAPPVKPKSPWTEEAIARLRVLWDRGVSASVIGRDLNMSRNAVIGKAHRIGLTGRPSPIRRQHQAEVVFFPTLSQLENDMCKWPLDLPGSQFRFCGCKTSDKGPYCADHRAKAYRAA